MTNLPDGILFRNTYTGDARDSENGAGIPIRARERACISNAHINSIFPRGIRYIRGTLSRHLGAWPSRFIMSAILLHAAHIIMR